MKHSVRVLLVTAVLILFSLATWAEPVDLNTATATDLSALHGVGPVKAAAIIEHRSAHGPFESVDDLVQVPGIGTKILDDNRDNLTVSGR